MHFPKVFTWGASTSAYQIEGATKEDGRGASVIDIFCRKPGAVWQGHTGEVAADHFHRWAEDLELMREIGLQIYRFSFAWPRILPRGTGSANDKGLAFYDRLVDGLLEAGIRPLGTLFHWDYPQELFCRGGWLNRDSSDWFADYAAVVVDRFSDRVTDWLTLNEPQCFVGFGHSTGSQPPGLQLSNAAMLSAGHNALLAHGKAVQVIRARSKQPCRIGCAPVGVISIPETDSPDDIAAAREATFSFPQSGPWNHFWNNTWWSDPMLWGEYPEEGLKWFGNDVPEIRSGDMETIGQPLDFCGLNLYSATTVRRGADGQVERVIEPPGHPHTAFRWPITPTILRWGPRFFFDRYQIPVLITENGMSNTDWVSLDGGVHDPQRIDFTHRHLIELKKAITDGVEVLGYLHWSLLDNFEWDHGYRERFGLVHVDYATGKRTPKDSSRWYAEVIRTNGACLEPAPARGHLT